MWRRTGTSGSYRHIASPTSKSYRDTAVTPGTYYYYRVRGWNSAGFGRFSPINRGHSMPGLPGPISTIAATDGTYTDYVHVSWSKSSRAIGYQLLRRTGLFGVYIHIATPTSRSYKDTTASDSVPRYYYKVRGYNNQGFGSWSPANPGYKKLSFSWE